MRIIDWSSDVCSSDLIFQQESPLVDSDATNQAADADAALRELGSDAVAFGYVTMTVVVSDPVEELVEEQSKAVERVVQGRGVVAVWGKRNAVGVGRASGREWGSEEEVVSGGAAPSKDE